MITWRPEVKFNIKKIKELFNFGSKLLVSSLINTVYRNLRSLVVGKEFTSATLGFLNRAEQLPGLIVNNIDGSIQSVLFPVYSSEQENREVLKALMRKAIKLSSFIMFPMMMGLAAVTSEIIPILLGDQWLPSVGLMQILCFEYVFYPIHTANLQAINSVGRSDVYLKLEIIKKIIGIILLLFSIRFGITGIALSSVLISLICTFINAYPNKKLLNYGYIQQVKDILPGFLIAGVMAAIVYSMSVFNINIFLLLVLKIAAGVLIYTVLAVFFCKEEVETLKQIIRTFKV